MCGAAARATQLEAVADNLANAQTPGFKAARPAFASFLPASGAPDKVYPAAVGAGIDLRPGTAVRTGGALDLYPEGGAFLAVRAAGGQVAFTRDGRLSLDGDRRLVSQGRPVLDVAGNEIRVPPNREARVDPDGSVRADDLTLAELARFRLEGNPDRLAPSLLAVGAGARAVPVSAPVRSGELESGNTQPLEATVQLISAQRAFDATMQALQTYRRMDDRAVEIGRVR
jgi:flagellar basal-body rod protein FlgF